VARRCVEFITLSGEDLVLIRRMPEIATSRKDSRMVLDLLLSVTLTNLFTLL